MTYQQLVAEIEKLPLPEQLSLLETLARLISRQAVKPTTSVDSLARVRGLLKPPPGSSLPTNEELENDYTDHLLRKYA